MGWYHGKQMLDGSCPSAKLTTVVEPYFLGDGADSPPGKTFKAWADEMTAKHGTKFVKSIGDVEIKGPTLALISGRTADNPRLLKEVIEAGATHVFLEKPGAPSVKEPQEMRAYAASKGVPVYMGYNKNVTPYVQKAIEFERKTPGASTTFVHLNAYKTEELGECFERNAEGMLKNMAIHELAVLATYYGVTVEGVEKFKSLTPEPALQKHCDEMALKDPDMMPYFVLQHDDYIKLKETATSHILSGAAGAPPGMATIDIAVETLRVAEYLTPYLQKALAK